MSFFDKISKYGNVISVCIIMISLVTIAIVMFRANKNLDLNYQTVLKEMDNTRKAIQFERKAYQLNIDDKMNEIITLEQIDSLLNIHYQKEKLIYKKFDDQLKNIPTRIAAIAGNDDSIRAAYRSFQ